MGPGTSLIRFHSPSGLELGGLLLRVGPWEDLCLGPPCIACSARPDGLVGSGMGLYAGLPFWLTWGFLTRTFGVVRWFSELA